MYCKYPRRPTMVLSPASRRILLILLALLALGLSLRLKHYGGPNLYGLQAQAWLEGRLDVPGPAEDLSLYGGRYYVAFPPFPSVVLLPVVALTGHERAPYRAVALRPGRTGGMARLASASAVGHRRGRDRPWLVAALLAGTALVLRGAERGRVVLRARGGGDVLAVLALEEALGAGAGARAGLWAGLAFCAASFAST